MNADQAKRLDFPEFLSRLGYYPKETKKEGRELFYISPLRSEKTASFHVSFTDGVWLWHDFGDGSKGSIIDFVMMHQNIPTIAEALSYLRRQYHGDLFTSPSKNPAHPSFSFQRKAPQGRENSDLEFVGVKPLQSPVIFKYLEGRRIDVERAKRYLLLVHYRNRKRPSGKPYFAFGQQNLSGGYEIRSANDGTGKFKSALICRDVTLWKGSDPATQTVNIFEGMLDHISLLVMYNVMSLKGDSLIMNSLNSYERTLAVIRERGYTAVNLFLDNDVEGQKTAARFQVELGDMVTDRAQLYQGHKDINAALVAGHQLNL